MKALTLHQKADFYTFKYVQLDQEGQEPKHIFVLILPPTCIHLQDTETFNAFTSNIMGGINYKVVVLFQRSYT